MRIKLFILTLFFLFSSNLFAESTFNNVCQSNESFAILYLNGVLNTEIDDAIPSREVIKKLIEAEDGISGLIFEDICFAHLYNQTDGLVDLAEVLFQKLDELNQKHGVDYDWEDVAKFLLKVKLLKHPALAAGEELTKIYVEHLIEESQKQRPETLDKITEKMASIGALLSNVGTFDVNDTLGICTA